LLAGFNVWLCDEVKALPLLAEHIEINITAVFLIASDDTSDIQIVNQPVPKRWVI
jgi:hypothetical protein